MSRILKVFVPVIATIVLLFLFFPNDFASAVDAEENSVVDFVLVLDCSGSMNDSDRHNLVESATKMFIDLLPSVDARISVIAFGRDYSKAYEYKYESRTSDKTILKYVKELALLQNVDSVISRNQIKNSISHDLNERKGGITYVGVGISAAIDILQDAGANRACVILMSDGRDYHVGENYTIRDVAIECAKQSLWPIYSLELNFDGANTENSEPRKQLRRISSETGGQAVIVESADSLIENFAEVLSLFYGREAKPERIDVVGGIAQKVIHIDPMTSEANLVIATKYDVGRKIMPSIGKVEVTAPGSTESLVFNANTIGDNISFSTDGKYAIVKLIQPKSGDWKITVHSDGVEIYLQNVSAQEYNVVIESDKNGDVIFPKGEKITISTFLAYGDSRATDEEFYSKYPAVLDIRDGNGNRRQDSSFSIIDSISNDDGNIYTVQMNEAGVYAISSEYLYEKFQNGRKTSSVLLFEAENKPFRKTQDLPDFTIKVGGIIDNIDGSKINFSDLFENPDNDEYTIDLLCKEDVTRSNDFALEIDHNGYISIRNEAKRAGKYTMLLQVSDGDMSVPLSTEFSITVEPSGERLLALSLGEFTLSSPSWSGVESMTEAFFNLDCYYFYLRPDQLPPLFSVSPNSVDGLNVALDNDGKGSGLEILAVGNCSGELTVSAKWADGVTEDRILEYSVKNWQEIFFDRWKFPGIALIVLAVVFVIVLSRRRVKGRWVVKIEDKESDIGALSHTFLSLGKTNDTNLKKRKVKIRDLIKTAIVRNNQDDVISVSQVGDSPKLYGTILKGKGVVRELNESASLKYRLNGRETKAKKIVLRPGDELTLMYFSLEGANTLIITVTLR